MLAGVWLRTLNGDQHQSTGSESRVCGDALYKYTFNLLTLYQQSGLGVKHFQRELLTSELLYTVNHKKVLFFNFYNNYVKC